MPTPSLQAAAAALQGLLLLALDLLRRAFGLTHERKWRTLTLAQHIARRPHGGLLFLSWS